MLGFPSRMASEQPKQIPRGANTAKRRPPIRRTATRRATDERSLNLERGNMRLSVKVSIISQSLTAKQASACQEPDREGGPNKIKRQLHWGHAFYSIL